MAEEIKYIKEFIKPCVEHLYDYEGMLFENNLSERCIAFRFSHHLQNKFNESKEYKNYFVDCDYNSSTFYDSIQKKCVRLNGKQIEDRDGIKTTGRFIDIIVHNRSCNIDSSNELSNLICFEIKKWNNTEPERNKKDRNNLKKLTFEYGYEFGFHLIFGETKKDIRIEIFQDGKSLMEPTLLFE